MAQVMKGQYRLKTSRGRSGLTMRNKSVGSPSGPRLQGGSSHFIAMMMPKSSNERGKHGWISVWQIVGNLASHFPYW